MQLMDEDEEQENEINTPHIVEIRKVMPEKHKETYEREEEGEKDEEESGDEEEEEALPDSFNLSSGDIDVYQAHVPVDMDASLPNEVTSMISALGSGFQTCMMVGINNWYFHK